MDDVIYGMSYNDILKMPEGERQLYLMSFEKLISELPDSVYSDYKTVGEMICEAEMVEDESISNYIFSGQHLIYYPNIKFRKVAKPFTCPVSGEIVGKGNEALIWKPLFWLPDVRETYVLSKSVRAHYYYSDFFPTSVCGLDDFWCKLNHSYDYGLDEHYNFISNVGGLKLKKLNRD